MARAVMVRLVADELGQLHGVCMTGSETHRLPKDGVKELLQCLSGIEGLVGIPKDQWKRVTVIVDAE